MITQLLNEVNEKIETLNNLVQDKEYFEKLDERIEKVNNYVQEQKQEIERLNNIINKAIEYHDNCINNLLDLDKIDENERLAYKVAYEIHDNYLNILKGSDKE